VHAVDDGDLAQRERGVDGEADLRRAVRERRGGDGRAQVAAAGGKAFTLGPADAVGRVVCSIDDETGQWRERARPTGKLRIGGIRVSRAGAQYQREPDHADGLPGHRRRNAIS
jgi:hypothetical protein